MGPLRKHAAAPGPRSRSRVPGSAIAVVAGCIGLYELLTRGGVLAAEDFPTFTDIVAEFVGLAQGSLVSDAGNTLVGWAAGLALAAAVAIPVGMAIGSSRALFHATRAIVEFLRPVPAVTVLPLSVLLWGTGMQTKILLIAYAAVWPMLIQAVYGVRDADPIALDTARSYRLTRAERIRYVILPGATPYLATGLRISASVSLIVGITVELLVGAAGLGQAMTTAQTAGAITTLYALVLATGLIGWALNLAFRFGERRLLRWHPSQRIGVAS